MVVTKAGLGRGDLFISYLFIFIYSIFFANVIARPPLPAEASVNHRVSVVVTKDHVNEAASRGCSGEAC